jgi:hypothetical protein
LAQGDQQRDTKAHEQPLPGPHLDRGCDLPRLLTAQDAIRDWAAWRQALDERAHVRPTMHWLTLHRDDLIEVGEGGVGAKLDEAHVVETKPTPGLGQLSQSQRRTHDGQHATEAQEAPEAYHSAAVRADEREHQVTFALYNSPVSPDDSCERNASVGCTP